MAEERTAYLRELVEAMEATGVDAEVLPGLRNPPPVLSFWTDTANVEWDGESEDGRVAFFLRDLVRRSVEVYAEGPKRLPLPTSKLRDWGRAHQWLISPLARFTAQDAADEVLALHRAGLLHKEGTDDA